LLDHPETSKNTDSLPVLGKKTWYLNRLRRCLCFLLSRSNHVENRSTATTDRHEVWGRLFHSAAWSHRLTSGHDESHMFVWINHFQRLFHPKKLNLNLHFWTSRPNPLCREYRTPGLSSSRTCILCYA
jgi:hypothetical protein